MKKNGFTLAEVLITLGIIGVIAALTLPTLSNTAQIQANAARLSTTVSDIENAIGEFLVDKDEISLLDSNELETNGFYKVISKYMKTAGDASSIASIYGVDNPFKGATVTYDYIVISKNGSIIFLKKDSDSNVGDGKSYGDVYIDVNGTAKPNKLGNDLFSFILGEDGVLYPGDDTTKALVQNGYKVK